MPEAEQSIISTIKSTETWKEWGRRYQRQLKGQGTEPYQAAEALLMAIPPDTYDSLMADLRQENDPVAFSNIVEELAPAQITAILEHYSAWGNVAVMQFFYKQKLGE